MKRQTTARQFGETAGGDWQPAAAVPERNGALCRKREGRPFRPVLTVNIRTGKKTVDRMREIYPWWHSTRGGAV